jgi:hypothetical protein
MQVQAPGKNQRVKLGIKTDKVKLWDLFLNMLREIKRGLMQKFILRRLAASRLNNLLLPFFLKMCP